MASNLSTQDVLVLRLPELKEESRKPRKGPGELRIPEGEPPDNWLYNTLSDPKLNEGLSQLGRNAAAVILGEPSGVDAVDMGTSMIPVAGPASILAAGGVPGIVDVAGAGELKNLAKIPKYTLEFVSRYFGEKGLKNLDNALTKYPKAGKPSVNDALYIMRTGLGGEQVNALTPYRSKDVMDDLNAMTNTAASFDEFYAGASSFFNSRDKELADRLIAKARETGDIESGLRAMMALGGAFDRSGYMTGLAKNASLEDLWKKNLDAAKYQDAVVPGSYEMARRLKELSTSPVQNWERIMRKQRQAQQPAKKAEVPKAETPAEVKAPVVKATEVLGGPGKWRENGWKSKMYDPNYFEQFGRNLSEDSKRDLFVVDSLGKHWVNQLRPHGESGDFLTVTPRNGLQRADARHRYTNYDAVSEGFVDDIKKNIATGNMPGAAVVFDQMFKKNEPVFGKTAPTLKLKLEEKPRLVDNPRYWADEAEGPDLYEYLFRPSVDRKLHALNPAYWVYD